VNKHLANQLVDELQRLMEENSALRQYARVLHDTREIERKADPTLLPAPTPLQVTEGKRRMRGNNSLASQMLAPLRAHIEQGTDWEQVAAELLRYVQPQEKVN